MEFNADPSVMAAFKALPAAERYLPAYHARDYVSGRCPLDDGILEILALPKEEQYSAWTGLARQFKTYVIKIYRHRDTLTCKMAKTQLAFLVAYLLLNNQWEWAEKIFHKLREIN
jgi:hypothetical protein